MPEIAPVTPVIINLLRVFFCLFLALITSTPLTRNVHWPVYIDVSRESQSVSPSCSATRRLPMLVSDMVRLPGCRAIAVAG